jgi:hypothetical protein
MAYPTAESLNQSFGLIQRIIGMQTDGLTHEDSLLQLPFRGNCLNWVLGHILVGRNQALELLGGSPVLEADEVAFYDTDSEPVTEGAQVLSLERLLADLRLSQERITVALEGADLEKLVVLNEREMELGQMLAGLHWHETYHIGQLEILRQLAGKNDKVI